jgi:hypothetical protein
MARIRSIHPGIFTDENYMALSIAARQLVTGLWCESSDDGVFQWKTLTLKARIFPVDNVSIDDLLGELVDQSFIRQFSKAGKNYGAIRNFRKFQRPKKPNDSGVLPDELRAYVGLNDKSSPPVPNQFPTSREKSPQMEDGGDKMEDGGCSKTLAQKPDFDLEFEQTFWPQYPRRRDKERALKAFRKARTETELQVIMAGLLRYSAEQQGQPTRFTKHAATWLNGKCWLDEVEQPPDMHTWGGRPIAKSNTIIALQGLKDYADEASGRRKAYISPQIEGATRCNADA